MLDSDIQTYLQRIGYSGELTPSLNTLNALTHAHTCHIPFENIAVLQQKIIALDEAALFQKLVIQNRGGYCFEQNGLFERVLKHLGFNVTPLAARVRLACETRRDLSVKTHLILKVKINGKHYITDVGVGACSLTSALLLEPESIQKTAHDSRRLQKRRGQWYVQILYDDYWQDICQFGHSKMPMIDRKVANWYVSTHPDSHFTRHLMLAKANTDGSRTTIKNTQLSIRQANGDQLQYLFYDNASLLLALDEHFSIKLPHDTDLLNRLNNLPGLA